MVFVRWQIIPRDVLSRLSDDTRAKLTIYSICQMTNCPQRRFEPFVRWQIVPRDVLSHLSGDKSSAETFWAICQVTNRSQRRFGTIGPSTLRKITIWEHLHSGASAWKGIFMDCHADARNDGWSPLWLRLVPSLNFINSLNPSDSPSIRGAKSARILFGRLAGGKIMDCHADARNDGLGTWVYKSFFTKIVSGGNLSKVFPRAWG